MKYQNILDYNISNISDKLKKEAILFDKKVFSRLLIKTALEGYESFLWELGLLFRIAINRYKILQHIDKNNRDYFIELIKGLLFLMENEKFMENGKIKIKITSPKSFVNISNVKSVNVIKNSLLFDLKESKLNKIPMRYETGKELLHSGNYTDWIRECIREMKDWLDLPDEARYYYAGDVIDDEMIDDEMIEYFIMDKTELIENIDIDFLRQKLNELEKPKDKGAPIKNHHLAYLLKEILQLLDREPTNDDFRLIFDYCNFFDIIDKEITSGYRYIRSIYRYYKDIIIN